MANKKTTVRRKPLSEINVVPYLDVMLVLLVVFMVTAPMTMQGVKVELPEVTAEPIDIPQDQDMITVSVKQDGSFYLNVGDRPTESKALDDIVGLVSKRTKDKPKSLVLVDGDARVAYGVIVRLMASLQGAGVYNVGLVTEEPAHQQ